jgi:putative transposase
MADYRRAFRPGGTFFFTIVTFERRPIFSEASNVERLRAAISAVMREQPFEFIAGVVLPDHAHYLWTLPSNDGDFSKRIGRMKSLFTKSQPVGCTPPAVLSPSHLKHRDAGVWQRRFWEHTIRDEDDFNEHLNYIHYNPVKHGLARCPHESKFSSFRKWVNLGMYEPDWQCTCAGNLTRPPTFDRLPVGKME